MEKPLDANEFYRVMTEAVKSVGYLSGESCKVLVALALLPQSRKSMHDLKEATCIDDNTDLVQAVSDLQNLNFVKFDGKGGVLINEALFSEGI
jgi:hypothetical protein